MYIKTCIIYSFIYVLKVHLVYIRSEPAIMCMGTSSSDRLHHIRFKTLLGGKTKVHQPSYNGIWGCFYYLLCVYATEYEGFNWISLSSTKHTAGFSRIFAGLWIYHQNGAGFPCHSQHCVAKIHFLTNCLMKIKALGYLSITGKYLLTLNRHLASSVSSFFKNPTFNQQM